MDHIVPKMPSSPKQENFCTLISFSTEFSIRISQSGPVYLNCSSSGNRQNFLISYLSAIAFVHRMHGVHLHHPSQKSHTWLSLLVFFVSNWIGWQDRSAINAMQRFLPSVVPGPTYSIIHRSLCISSYATTHLTMLFLFMLQSNFVGTPNSKHPCIRQPNLAYFLNVMSVEVGIEGLHVPFALSGYH
jgi:hypothetical protein